MAASSTNRRRILFVDDDPDFLEMIDRVMGAWGKDSWEIHLADNAGKVLTTVQTHSINLVVIDLNMPVIDGLQLLSLLTKKHPQVQKVVMTGFATEDNRSECLTRGAELLIEKPRTLDAMKAVFATLDELAKFQPQEGFRGVMRSVGIQDIIQMECLGRNSCILELRTDNARGRIFIRDGELIHATMGNVEGVDAFNRLMALAGGEFKHFPFEEPGTQTLEGSWEFLLMEASRLKDELAESGGGEAIDDSEDEIPTGLTEPEIAEDHFDDTESGADVFPTTIHEMVVCSHKGSVLYQWQCEDTEKRIGFLEFVTHKSRQVSQGMQLGLFDRLELLTKDEKSIVQIDSTKGVYVRSGKTALAVETATAH